jgi:hypothetical protein
MSDKKSIEKLFGDALGKGGSHPPKSTEDAIRKKLIEAGLLKEDKSKKRFFFGLWSISALVVLSVTLGYFLKDDHKNIARKAAQTEQNNRPALIGTEQQSNYNVQQDSLSSGGSEVQTVANENATHSNTNIKSTPVAGEDFKEDTKSIARNFTKPEKELKTANNKVPVNNKGAQPVNNRQNLKSIQADEKDPVTAANNAKAVSEENRNSGVQSDKNEKQDEEAAQNPGNKTAGEQGDSSIATSAIIAAQNTDTAKTAEKKNNLPPDSLAKEKNKKRISIDIFGAPLINSFKYQSINADFQPLADSSKKSESEKISFTAGVGINIPFKNFFVQPGISYSVIKSDFSKILSDTSGSHYNYADSILYILDSNHVVIDSVKFLVDSEWVSTSKTFIHSAVNKISVFEIPLWVGYKFSKGKFGIKLKTGASVSFITSVNTTLLDPYPYHVVLYDDIKNSPYRKNYFSLLAGASVIYNINDRFSIFLQPSFKYGLGSIFKSDYPVSKKIRSYSLGVGVRINF